MSLPDVKYYTYADYLTWDDDTRCELIYGVPYMMAGTTTAHQRVVGEILYQLYSFLKGKPCEVFTAPFDVRLNAGTYDDTVVQPDILVVCDKSKLDAKSCIGAPDMVVEVLSASSAKHDRTIKQKLYQSAGVREYWIIDPAHKIVDALLLNNGEYMIKSYGEEDAAPVSVLNGCVINLPDVFAE